MKTRTFISIGTKGTSLPLKLHKLPPPLKLGVNALRWANPGKVPEAEKAHGWVSENGEPFELYPLDRMVREGRVRRFLKMAWTGRADHQRHVGEAFFPDWWKPGDPQPLVVGVHSETWKHGCVQLRLNRDKRNLGTVARFESDSLKAAGDTLTAAQELSPVAEGWTNDELHATVTAYLQMLDSERTGQPYSKAGYNQRLRQGVLPTRSKASVELRMQNISATLAEIGHPWIKGYKPRSHVGEAVKARLLRLLRKTVPEEFALYEPSADIQKIAQRTQALLRGPLLCKPVGEATPMSVEQMAKRYVRNPAVQAFVRQQAAGACELCQEPAPFVDGDGVPFLEVHHVVPLADHGPDTVENAAALCPNCHRRLHYGYDLIKARTQLYRQVSRLQPPT